MLNTDGKFRLVFYTHTNIELNALAQALSQAQFIGGTMDSVKDKNRSLIQEYRVGDSFLSSITFMGCSPYLNFEPPTEFKQADPADFCFVRLETTLNQSVAYHTEQFDSLKTLPRCQHCRKVITDWHDRAVALNQTWNITCPHCEVKLTPATLDWRKASGVGNIFIEVMNVYLQEAIPTETFLQLLNTITTSTWHYFYTDVNIKSNLLDSR